MTPSQHKAKSPDTKLTEIGTSAWCVTSNIVEAGLDDEPEAFSNINTREDVYTWKDAPPVRASRTVTHLN